MKLIKIVLEEGDDLENVMLMNKKAMTIHLAKFLIYALENNMDYFTFVEIEIKGLPLEDGDGSGEFVLGCKREDYLEALHKQLESLVEFEEFELCSKLKEWISFMELEKIIDDKHDSEKTEL